jgi:hypothetical protein
MDVESYEVEYRKDHPRRHGRDLKLDDGERRDILLRHPCSSSCLMAMDASSNSNKGELEVPSPSLNTTWKTSAMKVLETWPGHGGEEEDSDDKEESSVDASLGNTWMNIHIEESRVVLFPTPMISQKEQGEKEEEGEGYSEQEMKRLERKLYRQRCTRSRWQSDFFETETPTSEEKS